MKKWICYLSVSILILGISSTALCQGGPTTISRLPYEITKSGSYKITKNLTSDEDGIIIEANDVSIDLNGYTMTGPGSGSWNGIYMNGRSNIEIKNGTIRDFGFSGIYETSPTGNVQRVTGIRSVDNGNSGIYLSGTNNLVKDCTVWNNGNIGIYTGIASTVIGNTSYNNGSAGISTTGGSTVVDNTAYNNGGNGFTITSGSTVKNNTAYSNQHYGIQLTDNNLVYGNTAYNNNQSGGVYTNISPCPTCTIVQNHAP